MCGVAAGLALVPVGRAHGSKACAQRVAIQRHARSPEHEALYTASMHVCMLERRWKDARLKA